MADVREQILARLAVVCEGVEGIAAVGRNRLDVPGKTRHAVIVLDGAEQFLDAPRLDQLARVQRVELSPEIELKIRSDAAAETGPLLSLLRTRLVKAVISDATLKSLCHSIRYEGNAVPRPIPEEQEPRMELNFVFTYALRLSDL